MEKDVAESFQELSDEVIKEMFRKFMSDSLIDKLGKFAEAVVNKVSNRRGTKKLRL